MNGVISHVPPWVITDSHSRIYTDGGSGVSLGPMLRRTAGGHACAQMWETAHMLLVFVYRAV